ncbi:MAG TPA: hypothetical protein VNN55_09935 [bacterium]|nr:hypothetical protein [bacterium]
MDTSSPRIGWLTDIHLSFLQGPDVRAFLESVAARRFDRVLITGDIGEADSISTGCTSERPRVAPPVWTDIL